MDKGKRQKKVWTTPTLRRMEAGAAESGPGNPNDGTPGSNNKRS
jgi:hypothetical protein